MISGWNKYANISVSRFRCGHCGSDVASNIGYDHHISNWKILICPYCDKPTYTNGNKITPSPIPGNDVNHLPDELNDIYREARNCCGVSAYTASVLACRKLLMNVAVSQGVKEGLKFIEYVDHLSDKGFIPPNGRGWVDHIRKKGNEANHEIALMNKNNAEELIAFSEMLLKFIYEFPARVPVS